MFRRRKKFNQFLWIIFLLILFVIFWIFAINKNDNSAQFDVYGNKIKKLTLKEKFEANFESFNSRLLTAFSGDHFGEALKSCRSIKNLKETQFWERGYMIAYLLKNDTSTERLIKYSKECPFVELRIFNATKYPEFVSNLYEYRWKPIIIEEVLKEVPKVFYFDSSAVFQNESSESLKDIFDMMDTRFSKCGVRKFGPTSHSIYSATHPAMLKYFNFSEEIAKANTMFGATLLVVTRNAAKIIQKWSNCAIEKACMAPEGSHRACDLPKLVTGEYGNCHRFDQSALSILLYQCSDNFNDYFQESPLLIAERWGPPPP